MVMVSVECKGKSCKHYRIFYRTQKFNEGEMPDFNQPVDEYCAHPDTYKPSPKIKIIDRTGTPLYTLKRCPND